MSNTLFSQSFLDDGLKETDEYQQINPQLLSHFGQDLRIPYRDFIKAYQSSNEAQIEDALIRPVLNALGWSYLPQQSIPVSGKTPDYMLFADNAARSAFTGEGDVSRYPLAPAEAKAWDTNLDQRAGVLSPSGQLQDYLKEFWQSTSGRNCSRLRGRVGLQSKFRAWPPVHNQSEKPKIPSSLNSYQRTGQVGNSN